MDKRKADAGKGYAVRFIRIDGEPIEEYLYSTKADADNHLRLFVDDKSGLYKRIAVLDQKTQTVEHILVFENGSMRMHLTDGDTVRLRKEYASPKEREFLFTVSNIHEDIGRCMITTKNNKTSFPARESVNLEMIEKG